MTYEDRIRLLEQELAELHETAEVFAAIERYMPPPPPTSLPPGMPLSMRLFDDCWKRRN